MRDVIENRNHTDKDILQKHLQIDRSIDCCVLQDECSELFCVLEIFMRRGRKM